MMSDKDVLENITDNIVHATALVQGLSEPLIIPLVIPATFFHILWFLGVSRSHASHVTCGCKESKYPIHYGRQSGYILPFWEY